MNESEKADVFLIPSNFKSVFEYDVEVASGQFGEGNIIYL